MELCSVTLAARQGVLLKAFDQYIVSPTTFTAAVIANDDPCLGFEEKVDYHIFSNQVKQLRH